MKTLPDNTRLLIITSISGLIGVVAPLISIGNEIFKYQIEFVHATLGGLGLSIAVVFYERYRYSRLDATSKYRITPLWKFAYLIPIFSRIMFKGKTEEVFLLFACGIYFFIMALMIFVTQKNQRILIE